MSTAILKFAVLAFSEELVMFLQIKKGMGKTELLSHFYGNGGGFCLGVSGAQPHKISQMELKSS
jgi:hypothetical protein